MPKSKAACPICREDVIAKCGSKKARHWAHKHGSACDLWFEETAWHLAWKNIIQENRCEVIINKANEVHRADIMGNRNTIIELQHSLISPDEILAREKFYGKMVWVFDAASFYGNMVFCLKDDYASIAWYYPRASFLMAKKPIYLHLPCGNVFKLEHMYPKKKDRPLYGWGCFIGWKPFFHLYLSSVAKQEYADGDQPPAIKYRSDLDISKLKFHHNAKIFTRCQCDARDEYQNCRPVMRSAELDHIKKILHIK